MLAVLWIVAALSLIVSGMVSSAHNELRAVSAAKQALFSHANGIAAINLVLQQMNIPSERTQRLVMAQVNFQGVPVVVRVTPLNGLVDINNAPLELMAELFRVAAQMDAPSAALLAQAALSLRSQKDTQGRTEGFDSAEDLLRVPGVSYEVYAKLAPSVTTEIRGDGKVNMLAASLPVLTVLTQGDNGAAQKIAAQRDALAATIDTTGINPEWIGSSSTTRYRVQAEVALDAERALQTRQIVDMASTSSDGLPWQIFRSDYSIEERRP